MEVPDGEVAYKDGPEREEFFIEHLHVFSLASTVIMANKAGFQVEAIQRLKEPSTKYTIRAFCPIVLINKSEFQFQLKK